MKKLKTAIPVTPRPSVERIVARAEEIYRVAWPDLAAIGDAPTCMHWTAAVIPAALSEGVVLVPQAGSASFRRLPPALDDGKPETFTHFSYMHDAASTAPLQLAEVNGRVCLPEVHVWAGYVRTQEIVDLSTRAVERSCADTGGMPWLEKTPPRFLWSRRLPDGWLYAPSERATRFVADVMRPVVKEALVACETLGVGCPRAYEASTPRKGWRS